MVESNPAWADKIVAVSLGEDLKTVSTVAAERGYRFQIAYDETSSVGERYEVQATPTILFKDLENKFSWRSSGISPSLEIRMTNFFSYK